MAEPLLTSPCPPVGVLLPAPGVPAGGPVGVAGSMRGEEGGVGRPLPRLCVEDLRRTVLEIERGR